MKNNSLTYFRNSLASSLESLTYLNQNLDERFEDVIDLLNNCTGHIIVTGFGKSSIIAHKFVASLNSISIPSIHMHANDATHGDLGVITNGDVVVFLSKSGNSPDLTALAKNVLSKGVKSILLTSNMAASLCDLVAFIPVPKEADVDNLIPTNSTLCFLAICDAIVITLKTIKKRNIYDFGQNHPSGTLGIFYFSKVNDLLDNYLPSVAEGSKMKEIISSISSGRKGATVVLNQKKVVGIITDGDLRRTFEKNHSVFDTIASEIMSKIPITISTTDFLNTAFDKMKNNKVSQLIIVGDNNQYLGILHIHDLINLGF